MTPEEQIEFQNKIAACRYQMLAKCDSYLLQEMDKFTPDWGEIAKAASVRLNLFREFLEMATLAGISRSAYTLPSDYGNWLSMVDKGADDERHEEGKQ